MRPADGASTLCGPASMCICESRKAGYSQQRGERPKSNPNEPILTPAQGAVCAEERAAWAVISVPKPKDRRSSRRGTIQIVLPTEIWRRTKAGRDGHDAARHHKQPAFPAYFHFGKPSCRRVPLGAKHGFDGEVTSHPQRHHRHAQHQRHRGQHVEQATLHGKDCNRASESVGW